MKYSRFLPLILVLLSACSAALPAVDWCYRYDFRNSNYGFSQSKGTWVAGRGFRNDSSGYLSLYYTHTSAVTPSAVIITVARPFAVQIPTKVRVEANIYGIAVPAMTTDVPADVNSADLQLIGSGGLDKLFIVGEATHSVDLVALEVRGNGANPFGSSNCSTAAVNSSGEEVPENLAVPGSIIDGLIEADTLLAGADVDLSAPNGVALVPALTNAALVFGYVKWITSGVAAQELTGPFAPIINAMGIYLVMNFAITGVNFVVYAGIYLVRWVIWLLKLAQTIIIAVAGIIGSLSAFGILILIVIIVAAVVFIVLVLSNGLQSVVQAIQDFLPG